MMLWISGGLDACTDVAAVGIKDSREKRELVESSHSTIQIR